MGKPRFRFREIENGISPVTVGMYQAVRTGPAWGGWPGVPDTPGEGFVLDGKPSNIFPLEVNLARGVDQVTFDETHGRPPYREGGPFWSRRIDHPFTQVSGSASCSGADIIWPQPNANWSVKPFENWVYRYTGGFCLPVTSVNGTPYHSLPSEPPSAPGNRSNSHLNPDLSDYGNRAYKALRPKQAVGSLAQSIIEMRDLPKQLRQTAELNLKAAHTFTRVEAKKKGLTLADYGSSHLAVQFGWKPLLDELRNIVKVCRDFDKLVETRKRQNAKPVEKRFAEDEVVSVSLLGQETAQHHNFCTPNLVDAARPWARLGSGGKLTVSRVRTMKQWYEGKFKVYWPEFDTTSRSTGTELNQLATLLGLRPDPVLLWKVTPWSWMVDWFADVSAGLQRLQDNLDDSVAAEYFYLMRRASDSYRFDVEVFTNSGVVSCQFTREITVKQRQGGESAFGFSPRPGGLTGFQQGILAALAINRMG